MDSTSYSNVRSCPKCGEQGIARVKRRGVLQTLILTQFGLYPWECGACREVSIFRDRGIARQQRSEISGMHVPPVR